MFRVRLVDQTRKELPGWASTSPSIHDLELFEPSSLGWHFSPLLPHLKSQRRRIGTILKVWCHDVLSLQHFPASTSPYYHNTSPPGSVRRQLIAILTSTNRPIHTMWTSNKSYCSSNALISIVDELFGSLLPLTRVAPILHRLFNLSRYPCSSFKKLPSGSPISNQLT